MSTADIKNSLHRMVVETDDPVVLEQIAYLFAVLREEKSLWETLSEQEKLQIQKGLEDIKHNRTKSHEEVRGKVRALLNQP